MSKKHTNEGFCCPEFVPPGAPDDFCIPEDCCPQRLETPEFPSPTSCLPAEQTRELEERIEATNDLLLNLALSNEQPEEGRMRLFEGLIGQFVEVEIDCVESVEEEDPELNEDENKIIPIGHTLPIDLDLSPEKKDQKKKKKKKKKKKILNWMKKVGKMKKRKTKKRKKKIKKGVKNKKASKRKTKRKTNTKSIVNNQDVSTIQSGNLCGHVHVVGRDFVLLRRDKKEILIPLLKISSIKPRNRFAQPFNEPELIDIDPCLRRAITFNFGETVASSPELIEIFFKMNLSVFLLIHLDKKIKIKNADEEFEGILIEVNDESLAISMRNGKIREIPFPSICFMII